MKVDFNLYNIFRFRIPSSSRETSTEHSLNDTEERGKENKEI